MGRPAKRSERLVGSGCVLICGALFLGFAVWQTVMLSNLPPAAADMGFGPYFLVTTGAVYIVATLLLFLGLRSVRRTLARAREA